MTLPEGLRPRGLRPPRVLSIAGTDPTGGAGIQADIKSIAASGGYAMAVVTSLVAQNTRGVRSVHTPPTAFLAEQLAAVGDDVRIDAVKIGMLGTAPVAREVRRWLDRVRPPVVVLDPVMVATSGDRLLDREAEDEVTALLGMASLVTPNVPELAVLTGLPPAVTWEDVIAQALQVSQRHGVTVLAKGGHLDGDVVLDAFVDAAGGLKGAAPASTSRARALTPPPRTAPAARYRRRSRPLTRGSATGSTRSARRNAGSRRASGTVPN